MQTVHLTSELTSFVIQHPKVDFVSFTGSVANGKTVAEAAVKGGGFMGVALEVRFEIGWYQRPCLFTFHSWEAKTRLTSRPTPI